MNASFNSSEQTIKEMIDFLEEEEDNFNDVGESTKPHEESIDAQVDKQFIEFEKEASETSENSKDREFESFSRHVGVVSHFLFEAGDDEDEKNKNDGGEEESDEESVLDPEKQKMRVKDLDMLSFAGDIVRLVENFDKLIEIQNTVVRRAEKFLAEEYDETVIATFRDVLEEEYGIVPGKTRYDREYEIQAPKAGAAGPYGS